MGRRLRNNKCSTCGEEPKRNQEGRLLCACGKMHVRIGGVEGTRDETEMLASHKFELARSADGDMYHVGPYVRLVWLYADGTWSGEPQPNVGVTLEDYLKEASQAA